MDGIRDQIHEHVQEFIRVAADGCSLRIVLDDLDIMQPGGVTGYFEGLVELPVDRYKTCL